MRVLVFGGTGFVGHSLVPLLRQRQHDVTVLSRGHEWPPRLAASGARLLRGDLLLSSVLKLDVDDVDAMVLLAAPRLFGKRLSHRRFVKVKTELTTIYANALELARRRGCPCHRLVPPAAAHDGSFGFEVCRSVGDNRFPLWLGLALGRVLLRLEENR